MKTERLRTIQQPSNVERLLAAYITRGNVLPQDSYPVRDLTAIPSALRQTALQAVSQGRVWACWAYGVQHWIFTAEMSLALSRERKAPVLHVNRYNDDGELTEAGSWLMDPHGQWRQCAD